MSQPVMLGVLWRVQWVYCISVRVCRWNGLVVVMGVSSRSVIQWVCPPNELSSGYVLHTWNHEIFFHKIFPLYGMIIFYFVHPIKSAPHVLGDVTLNLISDQSSGSVISCNLSRGCTFRDSLAPLECPEFLVEWSSRKLTGFVVKIATFH